jgi:uncharacterized protein DUF559/putative AbiEi antitoxin of type IV toxin-antitoxin system
MAILAGRQHGVVARRQLAALGLNRGAIRHRLNAGRLHSVHRGVYAVGHPQLTRHGRWIAGVLACGDEAVLSHRCGAALWGLAATGMSRVEVTVASRGRRRRAGIQLHQVRRLHPEDRSERIGIPVTSVARTLLDLLEIVDLRRLERAFEEAERMRLLDLRAIERTCERNPGRRGLRPLRVLLGALHPAPHTRSELERRFLRFCRDAGLPPPTANVIVEGLEVDALWPASRLVVELDGYAFHHTRAAFERDRARDATLQLAGYRVLRLTARRLAEEPEAVAETIRALLAQPPAGDAAGLAR